MIDKDQYLFKGKLLMNGFVSVAYKFIEEFNGDVVVFLSDEWSTAPCRVLGEKVNGLKHL